MLNIKLFKEMKIRWEGIRYETIPVAGTYFMDLGYTQTSDKMRVTDPCYDLDTWCAYTLDKVRTGMYTRMVTILEDRETGWGPRVSEISLIHMAFTGKFDPSMWQLEKQAHIGVDSGQAGFFDEEMYRNLFAGEKSERGFVAHDKFYKEVCDLTRNTAGTTSDKLGYVSQSGYGDGGYNLYTIREDGEVVAARIVFIGDDPEEE